MGLFRCAACGSDRVVVDKQTNGIKYNAAKGVAGTIALGAGGAIVGMENNIEDVYKCPDCGIVLSYPMPNEVKQVIDIGCLDASARGNLKLMGVPVSWDFLLSKYKNIDASRADVLVAKREEMRRASVSTLVEEIKTMIDDFEAELDLCKSNLQNIDELQSAWLKINEKEVHKIKSQMEQAKSKAQKEADAAKKKSEDDYHAISDVLEEEKKGLEKQNEELTARRSRLGIFRGKEKRQITETIVSNENRINEIIDIIEEAASTCCKNESEIDENLLRTLSNIEMNFPKLPESPYENRDRLLQLEKIKETKWYMDNCNRQIHPFIAYFFVKINGVVEINKDSLQTMMMIQESIYNIKFDAEVNPERSGLISNFLRAGLKTEFVDTKIMNKSGRSTYSING